MENGALILLHRIKCSIFHDVFKYWISQRCENTFLLGKGLKQYGINVPNLLVLEQVLFFIFWMIYESIQMQNYF